MILLADFDEYSDREVQSRESVNFRQQYIVWRSRLLLRYQFATCCSDLRELGHCLLVGRA